MAFRGSENALLEKAERLPENEGTLPGDSLSFMGERKDATYLLLVNEERRWFFSTKYSKAFPIEITLNNGRLIKINEKLQLMSFGNGL